MAMHKTKASIYILLEGSCISVYYLNPLEPFNFERPNLISKVIAEDNFTQSTLDQCVELLRRFELPIGRYFYGISGHLNNRFLRPYFKKLFKGANGIGVKAIRLQFSQLNFQYAERLRSGQSRLTEFKKDEALAVVFYEKSLNWWPHPGALLSLAYCNAFAIGTEENIPAAIRLFNECIQSKASVFHKQSDRRFYMEMIHGEAYYFLGYIYKHGRGVEQNSEKALSYFQLGIACKNDRCIEELKPL